MERVDGALRHHGGETVSNEDSQTRGGPGVGMRDRDREAP